MIVVELRGSHWVCNHTSDKHEALFVFKLQTELDVTKFCYQSIIAILTKYVIIKIYRIFLLWEVGGCRTGRVLSYFTAQLMLESGLLIANQIIPSGYEFGQNEKEEYAFRLT